MQTRSVATGLLVGFIIISTVLGGLMLSLRQSLGRSVDIPIPTITLEIISLTTPTLLPTLSPVASITPTPGSSPTPTATPSPTATACPTPPEWQRYVVGPFDTLPGIAHRFNTTVDQLVQANCLPQPVVSVGQTIFVPPIGPAPTLVVCYPPPGWIPIIVRPGDTLSAIAQRYGLSVYYLMRANCMTSSFIYAGQTLYVPYVIAPTVPPITPTLLPTDTPTTVPTMEASPTPTSVGPTDTPNPTPSAQPTPTDTPLPTTTPAGGTPTSQPPTDTPMPSTATLPPTVAPTMASPNATPAPLEQNTPLLPATP